MADEKRKEQQTVFWNCKEMKSFQSRWCWECRPW